MRTSRLQRKTNETEIFVEICLDGGECQIDTGIGFFDHMLAAFAMHGGFGLKVLAKGDLKVDCHHTVEDTGIVLGKAIAEAIGDRKNISRFGSFFAPMDEALAFAVVDISGRPFLRFDASFTNQSIGEFDTCMVVEFMRALAFNAGITLHIELKYGTNDHHKCEAIFKAVAHALRLALMKKDTEVLSTKGVL